MTDGVFVRNVSEHDCAVSKATEHDVVDDETENNSATPRTLLLPRDQFGSKRGHSTTDQVLHFSQKIRDTHNLKPTLHTVAAFIDHSKAFATVWRLKLITKIFDFWGISDRVLP
ncbi:RNA-directed DNA polymerase from mobile element jockey [Trichonephila clavipes]|nr:RNA-directed DNA polymerase from mobile element jockey [Trichonephila clavipes]